MLNSPSKQVIETRYIRLTTSHKIAFISELYIIVLNNIVHAILLSCNVGVVASSCDF